MGANNGLPIPARFSSTIAIHATDGYGNPAPFNCTPLQNTKNFATLGVQVAIRDEGVRFSDGTSFAVIIAAAVVATVQDYCGSVLELEERYMSLLRRQEGVATILELMSVSRGGYNYVAPWLLFTDGYMNHELSERHEIMKGKIIAALRDI
jgi:hypothetical protein